MEHFNEQGLKDLQEGNLDGAIDNSDLTATGKEELKEAAETFDLGKQPWVKVAVGAVGTIAALATPGFQAWGVGTAAMCFNGMKAWAQEAKAKELAAASANATV